MKQKRWRQVPAPLLGSTLTGSLVASGAVGGGVASYLPDAVAFDAAECSWLSARDPRPTNALVQGAVVVTDG